MPSASAALRKLRTFTTSTNSAISLRYSNALLHQWISHFNFTGFIPDSD
ncbi:Unknown protein sequence [Pseudomonas syringae pv. maculicola]|nr:Unknown protein sequence [Pseudomonas syringae pv. maculicola]